ncbi:dTDP-4-dehydrorhamnose reductase [Streptacidiphilus jiangxiensis]|uniref:dTDP-4-dehydrorhamnose reductase n=1 Tax=Streptacidiphilus jiangxiensis TaxID=235985 RepID=A0A1H7XLU3_STRJI|nr:dTDP-4-dehydrorhamnose reductase [Streptacidiphilus jiangxiensis]SEM33969.1 dTDP-4-dehydrorhamnose reductase [Streptacidiphilus jiangxiensis]
MSRPVPLRWLVTGAGGMLGQELTAALGAAGERQVTAVDRAALDVTDAAAVRAAVAGNDVVVNCAAYTNVDGAEGEPDRAEAVNGHAVGLLAEACGRGGARLLQLSTDYVLPGTSPEPQPEHAPTGPANAYGRSKLLGERLLAERLPDAGYVVRTAWLYGEHGGNFVATMLRLAAERPGVEVVDDQYGQPTWTAPLAGQLVALGRAAAAGEAPPGVYHGTAAGRTTWYGLARAVFTHAGLDPERVRPTTTAAFPRPAARPASSVLSHARWAEAGMAVQPDWEESLTEALRRPAFQELIAKAQG